MTSHRASTYLIALLMCDVSSRHLMCYNAEELPRLLEALAKRPDRLRFAIPS